MPTRSTTGITNAAELAQLASLDGLITAEVGERLYALAAQVPRERAIVELGSFRGKSTCYLAAGARSGHGARVWAHDAWDLPGNPAGRHGSYNAAQTKQQFHQQLAAMGLTERVVVHQCFSAEAGPLWQGPEIGLLYVDAAHDYTSVRADFEAWRVWMPPQAKVVFDDYGTRRNPGVTRLVDELRAAGRLEDVRLADPAPLAIGVIPG